MSSEMEVEVTTKVRLDLELVAGWFASLDDDSQARFFVEVCKAARNRKTGGFGIGYQWYQIGSHLRNCECSSDDAREMIEEIYSGLKTGTH